MSTISEPLFDDYHYPCFNREHILQGHQKYVLQTYASHGGNGVVYFAKQEKGKSDVAIKMSKIFSENEEQFKINWPNPFINPLMNGLLRECSFYSLIHTYAPLSTAKYFLNVIDCFTVECTETERPVCCLVLDKFGEKIEFESKFPLSKISIIAKQVFEAMAFIHSIDLIHADLSPTNILINNELEARIIDLGMTFTENECIGNQLFQTPSYRAPEVSLKIPPFTKAIDVWSLGCILVEWATGIKIFSAETFGEQFLHFIKFLGPIPDKTPGEKKSLEQTKPLYLAKFLRLYLDASPKADQLIDLITSILKYDPEERITAADALKHPFFT